MRAVLKAAAAFAALFFGQMLLTAPASLDWPLWARVPLGLLSLFAIAWGMTGRCLRDSRS